MRVTGGFLGGRRFNPPAKNWPTRPTTDISKEALYNILQNRLEFENIRMLDLFGGTGAHCLECISRGCTDVTYVDKHRPCVLHIKKLSSEWQLTDFLTIELNDVGRFIKQWSGDPYHYIFAGPPYPLKWIDNLPDMILNQGMLKENGVLVLEHNSDHSFADYPKFESLRTYGDTHFSFFHIDEK